MALAVAQPAQATFPGANGQIAYVRVSGEIWVMNPDGSAQTRIGEGHQPAWSPDGQRIAFVRWDYPNGEIFVMNADGSAVAQLTSTGGANLSPSWSPDGRRIVFVSDGRIVVMSSDGNQFTPITSGSPQDLAPDWSPDGRRIAFIRDGALWTVGPDGSAPTQITFPDRSFERDADPTWSPDGRRIAFGTSARSLPSLTRFDIDVVNADGTGRRRLATHDELHTGYVSPTWSPDGTQVAFTRAPSITDGDIRAINVASGALIGLTHTEALELSPDWGTHPPVVPRREDEPHTVAPPRDTEGPAVAIATATVRSTRRGAVAVRLRCPAGEPAGCAGRLTLRSAARRLGSASFRIGAGRTEVVRVRLSRAGLRLLRKRRRLRVAATVRATDQAGNAKTTAAVLLLKAPRSG